MTTNTLLNTVLLPLGITFLLAFIGTLYAPVFQSFLPQPPTLNKLRLPRQRQPQLDERRRHIIWGFRTPRPRAQDEEPGILHPIVSTRTRYGDILICGLDVIICGLIVYFTATTWTPPFGDGSPFYRYGLSSILAASFAYRYRGGLAATVVYECIILFGAFFPPPGTPPSTIRPSDIIASSIDAPLVAIIASYLATTIRSGYPHAFRLREERTAAAAEGISPGHIPLRGEPFW